MIEIEIDGKKYQAEPGKMIIEAADDAGIRIPRFCYHKKLSIAANCRMCLVDVEKAPKPLPACATPVSDGMIVRTQSAKALDAQRAVMEFLLINHPLDCPICDQGGECELQDIAMGYGKDISRYTEGKRSVKDQDIGALVATDMTRCIHCTRCVRFGQEILGLPELGTMGRGEKMKISTYVNKSLGTELSGNIIDLCPVGALTSKPFRFKARSWEMEQGTAYSPHDCVGSNIYLQKLANRILRVAPRENEAINEVWLSDRDRFSYLGLMHPERLAAPLVKENGEWREVDWQYALNVAVDGLTKIIKAQGAQKLAALISPNATTEEMYLFQKLVRGLGSHNVDHRLRITDVSDQKHTSSFPGMSFSIASIETQPSILLIGSHVQREQPIIAHRIHQAQQQGSAVFAINCADYQSAFECTDQLIDKPSRLVWVLAEVAKALMEKIGYQDETVQAFLADLHINDEARSFAEKLAQFKQGTIFLGEIAQNHPQAAIIRYFAELIAKLTQAQVGILTTGANSAGAWLAGAVPHRTAAQKSVAAPGLSAKQMFDAKCDAYLLFNIEPELDCAYAYSALEALRTSDLVVVMSPYLTETMKSYADVILPIVPFSETSGTYVNVEGVWQSFTGFVTPYAQARPGWKVLRVLANLCEVEGFTYETSAQVLAELKLLVDSMLGGHHKGLELPSRLVLPTDGIERLTEWPIYQTDNIVRRSDALQATVINEYAQVSINPKLADKLKVNSGDMVIVNQKERAVRLSVAIDPRIADDCAYIPAGFAETMELNEPFTPISLVRG